MSETKFKNSEQPENFHTPQSIDAPPPSPITNDELMATEGARVRALDLIAAQDLSEKIQGEQDPKKRVALFEQVVETLNLQEYSIKECGLEIRSDQQLSPQDLEFISNVKQHLDDSLNGGQNKPIKIFILNQKNWPVITKCMNLQSESEFSGASVELPITPFDGMQSVLLPSIDAVAQGVRRKDQIVALAENDPEIRVAFSRMDDDEKDAAYRSFYLRNMAAHEMSHLYQLSSSESATIASLSENPEQQSVEYAKFLPLREWLACAQGLYAMKYVPKNHRQIFLRINKIAADKLVKINPNTLTQEQLYPIQQANRTIQADTFFHLCAAQSIDAKQILIKMNQICASDDEQTKIRLQNMIEGEINEQKIDEITQFLGV